jgi:hypothetical protein
MSKGKLSRRAFASTAALMALTLQAPASTAAAEDSQPFHGTLTGTTAAAPCGQQLCLNGRDTGEVTHAGTAVMTEHVVVTFTGPCAGGSGGAATFTETAQLTAANGDTLNLSGSGASCHTAAGTTASSTLTPTSGSTGKFSSATGTITEDVNAASSGPNTETETVELGGALS